MTDVTPKFLSTRLKLLDHHLNSLWDAWRKNYLLLLQNKAEGFKQGNSPILGQIVLVSEKNIPRGKWIMGRVVELFKGRDGMVRSVGLKTASGDLKRAVQCLVPLEWPQNENDC